MCCFQSYKDPTSQVRSQSGALGRHEIWGILLNVEWKPKRESRGFTLACPNLAHHEGPVTWAYCP